MDDIDFEELDRAVDELMRKDNQKHSRQVGQDTNSEGAAKIDTSQASSTTVSRVRPAETTRPQVKIKPRSLASKPSSSLTSNSPSEEDQYRTKINNFLKNYDQARLAVLGAEQKVDNPTATGTSTTTVSSDDATQAPIKDQTKEISVPLSTLETKVASTIAKREQTLSVSLAEPKSENLAKTTGERKDQAQPVSGGLANKSTSTTASEAVVPVAIRHKRPNSARVKTGKFMDFTNKTIKRQPTSEKQNPVVTELIKRQAADSTLTEPKPASLSNSTTKLATSTENGLIKNPTQNETPPAASSVNRVSAVTDELKQLVKDDDYETAQLEDMTQTQTSIEAGHLRNIDEEMLTETQVFQPKIELEPSSLATSKPKPFTTASKSPFIEQAKVKKRPLGSPDLSSSAPNISLDIPEQRLTRLQAKQTQTALYRSELRSADKVAQRSKTSSNWGWVLVVVILLLVLAAVAYFFASDIKALFL